MTTDPTITTTNPLPPSSTFSPQYTQTIRLPSGLTLSYAESGSLTNPTTTTTTTAPFPLLLFHGFPGSRLEAQDLDTIGTRHNIRFICPDRPGFGLSTYQPGRRILDYPDDIRHLVGHLKLGRWGVLGVSGGGPYALACARGMRREEGLVSVGLVCPAAPWVRGETVRYVKWVSRVVRWLAGWVPGLMGWVLDWLVLGVVRWFLGWEVGRRWVDGILVKEAKTAGREVSEGGRGVEARRERMLEPFRQGAKASVQEVGLLFSEWGFRWEDVGVDVGGDEENGKGRIQIWHGTKDVNSPIEMVRWMKERFLSGTQMHELEGETHFTIMRRLEEICVEIVGRGRR